jgi:hypothetical protein
VAQTSARETAQLLHLERHFAGTGFGDFLKNEGTTVSVQEPTGPHERDDGEREEGNFRERARSRPRRQPDDDWPADYRQQFWDAYPNKISEKPALAALARLRRKRNRPAWADLMDGVDRYTAYMRKFLCPVEKYANPKNWIIEERCDAFERCNARNDLREQITQRFSFSRESQFVALPEFLPML